MARENSFLKGFEKKYASWAESALKPFKVSAKWYRDTARSPGFQAKKLLGYGALGGGGLLYGAHKLTHREEPQMSGTAPYYGGPQ